MGRNNTTAGMFRIPGCLVSGGEGNPFSSSVPNPCLPHCPYCSFNLLRLTVLHYCPKISEAKEVGRQGKASIKDGKSNLQKFLLVQVRLDCCSGNVDAIRWNNGTLHRLICFLYTFTVECISEGMLIPMGWGRNREKAVFSHTFYMFKFAKIPSIFMKSTACFSSILGFSHQRMPSNNNRIGKHPRFLVFKD